MAAGIATLDVYKKHNMFHRAENISPYFEAALHSLKGLPNVIDIRNIGLMGAIELTPIPGSPVKRVSDIFNRCLQKGLLIRTTGSTIALSPPLIIDEQNINRIVNTLADAISESAISCT
jgi:beta-alanine--pyruvate transaminase